MKNRLLIYIGGFCVVRNSTAFTSRSLNLVSLKLLVTMISVCVKYEAELKPTTVIHYALAGCAMVVIASHEQHSLYLTNGNARFLRLLSDDSKHTLNYLSRLHDKKGAKQERERFQFNQPGV